MLRSDTTPHQLAFLLGTDYSKLCYVAYAIGVDNLYDQFSIKKSNGGERVISAPQSRLKNLQSRLVPLLEQLYEPHPAATAFIKKRGILYNAGFHIKKRLIFNIDLQNFYGSIHFGRIKGLLTSAPYNLMEETARVIAHLCCYNKILPQGAPTSPVISNMLCVRLDKQLSNLAKRNKSYYTRYADDITFSFSTAQAGDIFLEKENGYIVGKKLEKLIAENGFKINYAKVRGERSSERQVVTGLKVNKKVNVDRRYIRTTKAMIKSLSIDVENANKIFQVKVKDHSARLENTVHGRVNFIGMIKGRESSVYKTLAEKFNALPIDLNVPYIIEGKESEAVRDSSFRSHQNISTLKKSVWVVDFEGIEGLDTTQELTQGTAFAIKDGYFVTCAHTFIKAGSPSICNLYRIDDVSKKYRAEITFIDYNADLAKLKLQNFEGKISGLKIYRPDNMGAGYRLALVGFPQLQLGHSSVTVQSCSVINSFKRRGFDYYEVDQNIMAGLSGGPVLNHYLQVVGMATMGLSVTKSDEGYLLEGNNAFLSAKHL